MTDKNEVWQSSIALADVDRLDEVFAQYKEVNGQMMWVVPAWLHVLRERVLARDSSVDSTSFPVL